MNNKRVNLIIYSILIFLVSIIIIFTKIDNIFILFSIYIGLSIYLLFNYFNDKKISYIRYMYILFTLITILFLIFTFSITSIIVSIVMYIIVITHYFLSKEDEPEPIIDKPEIKVPEVKTNPIIIDNIDEESFINQVKELYIDMQTYFMNLEYEKLNSILGDDLYNQFKTQMEHLDKTNKRAIRENIEIFDYKILNVNKTNNCITVNIGVIEDKYTKYLDRPDDIKKISYESFYDVDIVKYDDVFKIENLKLVYSHSKKN